MMKKALVVQMAILVLIGAACARRPTSSGSSVPSPEGATASQGSGSGMGSAPGASGDGTRMAAVNPGAAPVTRPAPKDFVAVADLKDVHFDFDRYEIRGSDTKILETTAHWLKSHSEYLVLIEGHADERGTDQYNVALGERRAKATMNYLVAQGIQATRMNIISYGEERPTCKEHAEGCWAQNRRAHFLVKAR
jgi:peptidoglycan-associated lipoprotein